MILMVHQKMVVFLVGGGENLVYILWDDMVDGSEILLL